MKNIKHKSIVISGNFILDEIHNIQYWPRESQLSLINKIKFSPGGSAFNISCNLKYYKAPFKIYSLGCIGDDYRGRLILKICKKNKINTKYLKIFKNKKTSFTNVCFSEKTKERTFLYYSGANDLFDSKIIKNSLIDNKKISIFHIGYLTLLKGLEKKRNNKLELEIFLKKIAQNKIAISADLVTLSDYKDYKIIIPYFKYIDHLIINEKEAFLISKKKFDTKITIKNLKECCKIISNYGIKKNIIIHSKKIVIWFNKKDYYIKVVKTVSPKYIVNSSGSGDVFLTGVLWGINVNFPIKKIINFSHRLALENLKTNSSCKFNEL